MQGPRQPKRLTVRQRVSGCVGNLIPNPNDPNKRQVCEQLHGNVVAEAGPKRYKVQFDNGSLLDIPSNSLRIERPSAFVPQNEAREVILPEGNAPPSF
jgi:hypothetical protein